MKRKNSDRIRLSPKYGVNSSLDTCFFCGKAKGIVLFGLLKGDVEAPHQVMTNYQPCEACTKKQAAGCTVIEVTTKDNGLNPIQDGAWPTGRWLVISLTAAKDLFKEMFSRRVLLEDTLFDKLVENTNIEEEPE